MKLKTIEFIKNNKNWKDLLIDSPYFLIIKEEDNYILLKYNQIASDFSNEIVRECRGLILDKTTLEPVCVPFFKFGNYGESYIPEIDWSSAETQEKVDGSIIKLWHHNGEWRVSTNGTINAFTCDIGQTDLLRMQCPFNSFGELFDNARKKCGLHYSKLNKHYTYMFELVSIYNKVVIDYGETSIFHIGTRNNKTLEEINVDIGIKKPKKYKLNTLEDCIKSAQELPYSEEGYVIVDKHWNRIKIKSPQYVAVHHIKNNGEVSISSIIQLIRTNEICEFLNYFPEYKTNVDLIKKEINNIIIYLEKELKQLKNKTFETQKDFAIEVKDKKHSAFFFGWRKDNNLTPEQFLWKFENNKIKEMIK